MPVKQVLVTLGFVLLALALLSWDSAGRRSTSVEVELIKWSLASLLIALGVAWQYVRVRRSRDK